MKKSFLLLIGLFSISVFINCTNKKEANPTKTVLSTSVDSLMYYLGQIDANKYISEAVKDSTLRDSKEKQDFLKGFVKGLNALKEGEPSYNKGILQGSQIAGQIRIFSKEMGVDISTRYYIGALTNSIMSDTLFNSENYYLDFRKIMDNIKYKGKSIPERLIAAENLNEIKKLIDGTTWHYTENLSNSEIGGWLKVYFKNGQYITYYATPSDGEWTEGGRGRYEITEGRYANTGKKFYGVNWKGDMKLNWITIPCEMLMTIDKDGLQLNVGSSFMNGMRSLSMGINEAAYYNATHKNVFTGKIEFGDYVWD